MSVGIRWKGKGRHESKGGELVPLVIHGNTGGLLIQGDSTRVLPLLGRALNRDGGGPLGAVTSSSHFPLEPVKAVYMDPPFATGRNFRTRSGALAYSDRWASMDAYLDMLHRVLKGAVGVLAPDGWLFLHGDSRAIHHGALVAADVFGDGSLKNDIVWSYGGRGAKFTSGQLPRNHDTILAVAAGPSSRFRRVYAVRKYPLDALPSHIRLDSSGRPYKTAPRGDYTDESIARLEAQGRVVRTSTGSIRIRYWLERRGRTVLEPVPVGSVWSDIPDMMHAPRRERWWGYPTQKPLALLQRILDLALGEADAVLDPFAGSGTTLVAAHLAGRRWIGVDGSPRAVHLMRRRLVYHGARFTLAVLRPHSRTPYVRGVLERIGATAETDRNCLADGRLGDAAVVVRGPWERLTCRDLRRIARKVARSGVQRLVVLAWHMAPDVADTLAVSGWEGVCAGVPVSVMWTPAGEETRPTVPGPLPVPKVHESSEGIRVTIDEIGGFDYWGVGVTAGDVFVEEWGGTASPDGDVPLSSQAVSKADTVQFADPAGRTLAISIP